MRGMILGLADSLAFSSAANAQIELFSFEVEQSGSSHT